MGGLFLYICPIGIIRKTWLVYALYRQSISDKNYRILTKVTKYGIVKKN